MNLGMNMILCDLFGHQKLSGAENMSLDEVLFHRVRDTDCVGIIRFYSWIHPCISLGYFQKSSDINLTSCTQHQINVVRRMTGGRAVYHGHDFNVSFIFKVDYLKPAKTKIQLFQSISNLLISIFATIGLKLNLTRSTQGQVRQANCFLSSSVGELQDSFANKRVGSALLVRDGVALMQNSIPVEPSHPYLNFYLNQPSQKSLSPVKDASRDATEFYSWNNIVLQTMNTRDKIEILVQKLQSHCPLVLPIQIAQLSQQEKCLWQKLIQKYKSAAWNQRI